MRYSVLVLLASLICAASSGATGNTSKLFELVIIREPDTLQCKHLSVRETHQYRGIPREGLFSNRILDTGEERIRFVAHGRDTVWDRAERLCGESHTWGFHVLLQNPELRVSDDIGQTVLQPSGGVAHSAEADLDIPPLEIFPLVTSGESSNRVDLVFFADGCEAWCPNYCLRIVN